MQEAERGEVGGFSERSLIARQSVEGAIEVVQIKQNQGKNADVAMSIPINQASSLDDVRPIFSMTFSEDDLPVPQLESEIKVVDNSSEDEPSAIPIDESDLEVVEIAPPALAPPDDVQGNIAPPDYNEAPPIYEPLNAEDEVEELEGLK